VRVDGGGFGHEISAIEGARNETYTRQILTGTITDPVKAHISTLRRFWGDGRGRRIGCQHKAPLQVRHTRATRGVVIIFLR
jgi:hypothetical protein